MCGSLVHATALGTGLCAAAGEPARLPRHDRFSRDRRVALCDCGRPKGLSHPHGGWAAGCGHRRVRRIDAASDAPARGVSRARSLARVSACEDSQRLVILDGTPALLSRLVTGDGAKSPSRLMAQLWARASRAYDV